MKYLSVKCVADAYLGFQESIDNKLWGYLALMQACDKVISPSVSYEINSSDVSNFLEETFNLNEQKKRYDGTKTFYVFFSSRWKDFFLNKGSKLPNIYDVAVWAFRRRAFEDDVNENIILNTFAREFNIPIDSLEKYFDSSVKPLIFESSLYSESDLKTMLAENGVDVSKDKIDAEKKGIVAEPGQINRGPFTQPLYTGLDVTDYVLILQSNFYTYYNPSFSCNANENILSTDELVNRYKDLVTSQYSTAGNAIFMASYGNSVMQLKLKASDIYNRAIELYPEHTAKFRAQELNHAFKMYSYFLRYPELMHLPGKSSHYSTFKGEQTNDPLQQIYYGAPGTGKSNEIKKMTAVGGMFTKDCTFRTTFHPDSDYASFVGAYKPYWDKEQDNGNGRIVYGFRPQSFLKAYIKAWKNPDKNVALVVEEINRGNCAQIFGDIFQLLDREKNGLSKYPVECDVEMQELLVEEFAKESKEFGTAITDDTYADSKEGINNYYAAHYDDAFDKIKNGEILALPMNLSILATMNTSDQSLFPMDSAFKRRWEWIYEPIVEGTDKDGNKLEWKIEVDDTHSVDWWKFLQKINAVIYSLTSSEDKQLGYFFCQPDKEDGVTISRNLFVGKVIFYLWNEIFKDYAFEHDVCKKENKSETLYFADFYEGKDGIKQTSLEIFFSHLDENQPKIDNKDVKLVEEKVTDTSADGNNNEEPSPEVVDPEQNVETETENTEA